MARGGRPRGDGIAQWGEGERGGGGGGVVYLRDGSLATVRATILRASGWPAEEEGNHFEKRTANNSEARDMDERSVETTYSEIHK